MTKVRLILLSILLLALASCQRDGLDVTLNIGPYGGEQGETRKVMLLYEAGFSNLSSDIKRNIAQLQEGPLPGKNRNDDVILVFSHVTRSGYEDTAPTMVRLYSEYGEVCADTLKVWPMGTPVVNKELMTEVFNWVHEEFPAASYGAILASHGTGWLPEGYFGNPKKYEGTDRGGTISWSPRLKTFGLEYYGGGKTNSQEMEIKDLVESIPYHLDYILFDACLMGTVEVAWALKDICDYLIAIPTETPSPGFDYSILAEHLLAPSASSMQAVCEDYYLRYTTGNYAYYGACITLIDCRALEGLAAVCKKLFAKYRDAIRSVDGKDIQTYDRRYSSKHYYVFFDLLDMIRVAGASDSELAELQAALDQVVLYENHTKETTYSDPLLRCCGLSMYLPAYPDYKQDIWHGTQFLDDFYKQNIAWNQATSLVE